MKIPLHKIPADVRCKMLPCCHIALKFIGVFVSKNYSSFESLSSDIFGMMFIKGGLRWLYLYAYTNIYRLCIIRYYNQSCAYFVAFLTTDSVGPISTDADGKLVTRTVHIYGNFWLREITKSSVMLADT